MPRPARFRAPVTVLVVAGVLGLGPAVGAWPGPGEEAGPTSPACADQAPGAAELVGVDRVAGAVALGASALGCTEAVWAALPPTPLERTEPGMLLALVTRDRPVEPLRYEPDDLVAFRDGPYDLRQEVADQLEAMFQAAAEAGHPRLVVSSGFRAYDTQAGSHEDWVRRLGAERADQVSARPGHSEHQLGLAVDVGGACGLYQCFGTAEDGRWVADNAHRWGFIVRYPEGGEKVTGYDWEPWHLRYVGPRAAWQMRLTGEAYWEYAQPRIVDALG